MSFKIGGIMGAIAIFLSSGVAVAEGVDIAIAQDTQRYVTVGHDKLGNSIALDTKTIKGTTYKLYGIYGDGVFETTFDASCTESRLFLNRIAIYGSEGELLQEDKETGEIPFVADSSPGKGMQFVCEKIGARGW
ncbi:MAG: hypothetical protein RMY36_017780 [Nostoc sp. SerVER01]|uniref:hypothetical protein n=1 Tax=Nostoc sp. CCY 9925 TaxID=3103865 RepID=UPI002AD9FF1C|nr:hypothetical protein [Nostoc sp. SerVER01]MDZ8028781.1 hypothetical protein [Nostoc sp. DedQUE11]MDZ8074733.1 hypothetical protein [Nostoc sp. DedQUE01]MDZ8083307.1 hypothetical protein [Nostoc sp. DcaGUA01]